jgi:hypothetical protein
VEERPDELASARVEEGGEIALPQGEGHARGGQGVPCLVGVQRRQAQEKRSMNVRTEEDRGQQDAEDERTARPRRPSPVCAHRPPAADDASS